jgi:hypothetical protein
LERANTDNVCRKKGRKVWQIDYGSFTKPEKKEAFASHLSVVKPSLISLIKSSREQT